MTRRLLTLFFVIGFCGLLQPRAWGLEGIVLLPDGNGAVDATVSILGQPGATRTGPDGRFTWVPDPRPPFSVLVVLAGGVYTAPVLIESLPADEAPVAVQISLQMEESVTVTAGATPHTEAPPGSAALLVGREELSLRQPPSLLESIEAVPGVGQLGAGQTAVPSIRGLARGRTLILIDGARVTSERRAGPSASFLDPFFLEAVEVARGLGSVSYGSDAFGGVIHARTRQAAPGSPLKGRLRGSLGAGIPERSVAGEIAKGWEKGGGILQARLRRFEDYRSPRGEVPVSGADDGGFRAWLGQEWGAGRLQIGWQSDFGRDVGKPALEDDATLTVYPLEDSHRLSIGYQADPRWGFSRLEIQGFLGWNRLATERTRLAVESSSLTINGSDVQASDYGLRASGTRELGGWRLNLGLDLNGRVDLEALGTEKELGPDDALLSASEEVSIADAARRDAGAYVWVDGALLSLFTTAAGVRVDAVRTRNEGGYFGDSSTSNTSPSGFLSVTAGPFDGTTITGQVGWGFRDPTLSDRYFRGVTGRGFITGSPDLEPERSTQYELALRRTGRVRAALYLYHYTIEDLIERYRSGDDFFFRNRGEAIWRGVELELAAPLPGGLSVELGAQAASGRTRSDDELLDDVPGAGLTLTLRKALGSRGSAWLRGIVRAADNDPGPTELGTPAYTTIDASLSWRWGRHLESTLVLRNLLDEAYPQSPDERSPLAPGRSVLVTISATF